jgi:hypothetical protein
MKRLFTIAFLVVASLSGFSRQSLSQGVGLSPVPLWPQDGDTSKLPAGHNVFYDPHSGEYVVFDSKDAANGASGLPTVLRFAGHALVDPQVTFAVTPSENESFLYTYDIANGKSARQSIQKISVLVFADATPQASRPNWTAGLTAHDARDLATPAMSQASIEWTPNNPSLSIAPGNAVSGFVIRSASLPGFGPMIFKGGDQGEQPDPDLVASLPQKVRDQLAGIFKGGWDTKNSLVIGPRFSKGTSPSTIAQNFLFGLQSLVRSGKLDANSPFVQRARQLLSSQVESGDQMLYLNSGSLDFTNQAKSGLESAIARALEVAFGQ